MVDGLFLGMDGDSQTIGSDCEEELDDSYTNVNGNDTTYQPTQMTSFQPTQYSLIPTQLSAAATYAQIWREKFQKDSVRLTRKDQNLDYQKQEFKVDVSGIKDIEYDLNRLTKEEIMLNKRRVESKA